MLIVPHGYWQWSMELPGRVRFAKLPKWNGIGVRTQEPVVTHEYMSIWVTTDWTQGGG